MTRTMTVITREQIEALPVHRIADVLRLASSVDVRARGDARRPDRLRRSRRELRPDAGARRRRAAERCAVRPSQRRHSGAARCRSSESRFSTAPARRCSVPMRLAARSTSITRRDVEPSRRWSSRAAASAWSPAEVRRAFERGAVRESLGRVRSIAPIGFMYDRDFKTDHRCGRARRSASHPALSVSFLWKEFGANNFYGGNAPSREWTNQTLLAADHRFGEVQRLEHRCASASYRTHGDRFRLQPTATRAVRQPASHARGARPRSAARGRVGAIGTLTVGVEGGGDWIRSTNLGDHETARVSGFGEWRQEVGRGRSSTATLRVDRYNEFGTSWNPSLGVGWWAASTRAAAGVGRSRVPRADVHGALLLGSREPGA